MTDEECRTNDFAALTAKPINEPDRAKVKWPKPKKVKVIKFKRKPVRTELAKTRHYYHPGTKKARVNLHYANRDLDRCEACEASDRPMTIHHVDHNPTNDAIENLQVLCRSCHAAIHNVEDHEVLPEEWGVQLVDEE